MAKFKYEEVFADDGSDKNRKGYELFRQVKHIFDPKNIFNPGKKIDVDWNWALAHFRND